MKKIFKIVFIVLLLGFIAIQFFNRPDKTTTTEVTPGHITKVMSVSLRAVDNEAFNIISLNLTGIKELFQRNLL